MEVPVLTGRLVKRQPGYILFCARRRWLLRAAAAMQSTPFFDLAGLVLVGPFKNSSRARL